MFPVNQKNMKKPSFFMSFMKGLTYYKYPSNPSSLNRLTRYFIS